MDLAKRGIDVLVPHIWLKGKRSLYDELGDWFTLVRTDASLNVSAIEEAARLRKVPLKVLDISLDEAQGLYDRKLVLARPDQHIGWRGDAIPQDPVALIDLIRGAA